MMTRRQFHRMARAGIVGVGVGAGTAVRAANHLDIGVGTFSYHNLSIGEMIVQLKELDIREIELSHGEFMLMKPPTIQMCQSARGQFDRAGIRCVSYYTATIKDDRDID